MQYISDQGAEKSWEVKVESPKKILLGDPQTKIYFSLISKSGFMG